MADGMLEVLSPPTLGTSANNGDDSSFELCAIAFFFLNDMDKDVRENGVGIRSLIAAWSCAASHGSANFLAALAGKPRTAEPPIRRTLARIFIIDGRDIEWDTHWHPHEAHPHARRHGRTKDARSP